MAEKAYVRIHSQKTIQVTCGLQNKDVTNPDAHVPDRLKVSPQWPRCSVIISEGSHLYPSEIASWNTVKALERDKIITIGGYTNEIDDEEDKDVKTMKETLVNNMQTQGIMSDKTKDVKDTKSEGKKLADIAGE